MLNVKINEIRLNNITLLKDINFKLENNRIYTIIGPNGSGKSTLINSLTCLLDKRFYSINGKVIFHNKDLLSITYEELLVIRKNFIKYVFQDAINSFDPLKKFEFYFKIFSKNEVDIESLLKFFLLPDKINLSRLFPYEVSGGMAQRIGFVLALLNEPEILILDEPTSGIDSAIANLFLLKIRQFASQKNNIVLLVTHDIKFAQKASHEIAFLANRSISKFTSIDNFSLDQGSEFADFNKIQNELV